MRDLKGAPDVVRVVGHLDRIPDGVFAGLGPDSWVGPVGDTANDQLSDGRADALGCYIVVDDSSLREDAAFLGRGR
jgi:hypothetical protein